MSLAAVSFAAMSAFVKFSAATLPPLEIVFFRSLLGSIAIMALMAKKRVSWAGNNPKILVLRAIFGFGALSLYFYTISRLDLGTAVMLNFTAPLFVVVLARILLKETTGRIINSAILASFAGLYFLAAPQFEIKPVPILIGISSGIFAALAHTMIRFSDKRESHYTIIFYFTAISTVASGPLLFLGFEWPNAVEWMGLIGVSTGAFFGQIWLTQAIQLAPVSRVSPFLYLAPVAGAFLGAVFWKEFLSLAALAGGAVIITSGIVIYRFRDKPGFVPIEE